MANHLRAACEQEAQWIGNAQYPLARRLFGKDLLDQQRSALGHMASSTTGAQIALLKLFASDMEI